jgi:hypothetical protein
MTTQSSGQTLRYLMVPDLDIGSRQRRSFTPGTKPQAYNGRNPGFLNLGSLHRRTSTRKDRNSGLYWTKSRFFCPWFHTQAGLYSKGRRLRFTMDEIQVSLSLVPYTGGPLLQRTETKVYNGRNPGFLVLGSIHRRASIPNDSASGLQWTKSRFSCPWFHTQTSLYSKGQRLRLTMDEIQVFLTLVPDTDEPLLQRT